MMRRNPAATAYAWWRYRRAMRWLLAAAVALMLAAARLAGAHADHSTLRCCVLAALAIGAAMLITSLLMGLLFLRQAKSSNHKRR